MKELTILSISGSLRTQSSNTTLLRAAEKLVPNGMKLVAYEGLGLLPHFNPDLDGEQTPAEVKNFRKILGEADGLLISSPEYAHGIPGTLKNAFDWLVSTMEIVNKPLVLINASTTGGEYSLGQMMEILRTMNANVLLAHSLQGFQVRRGIDAQEQITDPQIIQLIQASFQALTEAASPN